MASGTTETLQAGDKALEFSLTSANAAGRFTLAGILEKGPTIIEFLRGTW